ncbi:3'-5' exonuclease [Fragilaria crotonensis]|nr:3'-5' exonuclease [Fragilaria crotonensis]
MGRWKRKKEYYSNKKSSSLDKESDDDKSAGKPFAPLELERVKAYLREYRDGCYQVLNVDQPDNIAAEVTIGGHTFPVLSPSVLSQPYLALPTELSSKQRRSIHELALDLDLFHESQSPTDGTRNIVLSIFSDGFSYLQSPGLSSNRVPTIPFRKCRPWFCRAENNVESCTNDGRKQIEALMDQPGDCIRSEYDHLDYEALDGANLSTVRPISSSDGDEYWMFVDSEAKMKHCAQELLEAKPTELAFDLEFYNPSKYLQVTCLLQLSSNLGKDYVIDPFADGVWDQVALLRPLFANPDIVKIGHCVAGDVQSLHRDFGIFVVNVFDTYEAAKVMNLAQKGLDGVCQHFGLPNCEEYSLLKRTYQSTDWRRRPLIEPMVRYGRYDVHYLVSLRTLFLRNMTRTNLWDNVDANEEAQRVAHSLALTLRSIGVAEGDVDDDNLAIDTDGNDLPESNLSDDDSSKDYDFYTPPSEDNELSERKRRVGAKELRMQPALMRAISASQQQCLFLWTGRNESLSKCARYGQLMKQAENAEVWWKSSQGKLLEDLIAWRTEVAAKEECLEGMVCSLDLLVSIATKTPTSEMALRRIQYHLPELLEEVQYREEMLAIVKRYAISHDLPSSCDVPSYPSAEQKGSDISPVGINWNPWYAVASVTASMAVAAFMVFRRSKR